MKIPVDAHKLKSIIELINEMEGILRSNKHMGALVRVQKMKRIIAGLDDED